MPPLTNILVYEPDDDLRAALGDLLLSEGFAVHGARTLAGAIDALHQGNFMLVLADHAQAANGSADDEISRLIAAAAPIPVGCTTLARNISPDLEQRCAFVLRKPFDVEQLLSRIGDTLTLELDPARRARAEQYFAALTARAWDAVAEQCTEDVEYHVGGNDPEFSRTVRGRAAFRDFTRKTFQSFPEARFEVAALSPLPTGLVARFVSRWTAPDGVRKQIEGSVVFAFSGSQIARVGVRMDVLRLRRLVA